MIKKTYQLLASLNFGIWLIVGVLLLMAAGSFASGEGPVGSLNDMPLFVWLGAAPLASSWWLWGAILLLALLAVNTVLCSIEALRTKLGRGSLHIVLAPHAMHLGFLFIMLAHLLSAKGAYKQVMQVQEQSVIGFPDGSTVRIGTISATPGPRGMMKDFGADMHYQEGGKELVRRVRPNEPLFHKGVGIYVKDVGMMPMPAALVEIHREPGAGLALAGALLFSVGNVVLVAVRRGK